MYKKILLLFIIILAATPLSAATSYEIYDVEDLQDMNNDLAGDYYLMGNIDASVTSTWNDGAGFDPIGSIDSKFSGDFYGNNYTISNLYFNRPTEEYCGLFGYVENGNIYDVAVTNANVSCMENCGIITGAIRYGEIENCYVTGTVSSHFGAGLVASDCLQARMYHCAASGTVNCDDDNTGGLVGLVSTSAGSTNGIHECYTLNTTVNGGVENTGGLAGKAYDSGIYDSYADNVTVTGQWKVGGLIGYLERSSRAERCFSTGTVVGTQQAVGGLIGCTLEYLSVASAPVVQDCYSHCSVAASDSVTWVYEGAGGLVGQFTDSIATNCYSTGTVSGVSSGGLVGKSNVVYETSNVFTSSYYDTETSGQSDTGKGTGLTTLEMMFEASYVDWDFDYIWTIDGGIDYPVLQNVFVFIYTAPVTEEHSMTVYYETPDSSGAVGIYDNDLTGGVCTDGGSIVLTGDLADDDTYTVTITGDIEYGCTVTLVGSDYDYYCETVIVFDNALMRNVPYAIYIDYELLDYFESSGSYAVTISDLDADTVISVKAAVSAGGGGSSVVDDVATIDTIEIIPTDLEMSFKTFVSNPTNWFMLIGAYVGAYIRQKLEDEVEVPSVALYGTIGWIVPLLFVLIFSINPFLLNVLLSNSFWALGVISFAIYGFIIASVLEYVLGGD